MTDFGRNLRHLKTSLKKLYDSNLLKFNKMIVVTLVSKYIKLRKIDLGNFD